MLKKLFRTIAAAAVLAVAAPTVSAQGYPSKPIRIIVPYTAGGFADTGLRAITEQLGARLGQQVIVDNRPGAGGAIGVQAVAQAAPDGHTLLLGFDGTLVVYPHLVSKLPFDTLKDFAPVTKLGDGALLLVAHPSLPAKNLGEFIAFAKGKPGSYPFGTSGNGSTPHLAGELLKNRTGIPMEHIAYKGGGQATVDVLGGQIPLVFTTVATAQQHVKAGKLTALGVSGAKRSQGLPDTPTFIESGLPGFDVSGWVGVFAPAKTPRAVIERMQKAIAEVLTEPAVRARYETFGIDPVGNTPQQFAEQIRADLARWAKVVKDGNIALE